MFLASVAAALVAIERLVAISSVTASKLSVAEMRTDAGAFLAELIEVGFLIFRVCSLAND